MSMNKARFALGSRTLGFAALVTGSLLTGCGSDSDSSDDEHQHTDIESAGRLALFDTDASELKVLDLDDGEILASFAISGEAPSLYASPGLRYIVAIQRGDDLVSFVDGGLYTEDHGDHMHDYEETPSLLSLTLNDNRPTHYSLGEDHGIVFFDGGDAASSKVTLFSDASLGDSTSEASLELENNMHGVAKLADDHLFVTYRDSSITDTTLPAAVERYHFEDDTLSFETRYDEPCPGLHGAAANEHVVTFGCSDGVLVIDLEDADYAASKLANPDTLAADSRIGSIAANHHVHEVVGVASNQLFVIDAEDSDAPYTELSLGDGVDLLAYGFSAHGDAFYALGSDGDLRLFDPEDNWSERSPVTLAETLDGATAPSVTVSAAEDSLFVLLPDQQAIVEVDTDHGEIKRTLDIDFSASGLTWVGLSETEESAHSH